MNWKVMLRDIAMAVSGIAGLDQFSRSVRAVSVLGLFASGILFGVSLVSMVSKFKAHRPRV